MPYSVRIQDNESGEIRTYQMGEIEWNEHSHFWWTEGNFGCDCNRGPSFQRAGGVAEEDIDWPVCSESRYTVIDATLSDGTVIPIDEPARTVLFCSTST